MLNERTAIHILRGLLGHEDERSQAMALIIKHGGNRRSQLGLARLSALLALANLDIGMLGEDILSQDGIDVLICLAQAQQGNSIPERSLLSLSADTEIRTALRDNLVVCARELRRMGIPLIFPRGI